MKRIISFLLLLAIMVSVFVGCANDSGKNKDKNPTNKETEEIDYENLTAAEKRQLVSDDLPEMSFNNR
jgi:cytochrome oxidase Cu insertion factor (SCO1/SenC/PrrC family)